ncbi:co-chaperone GrpE family protein [Wolffia australiana]
MAAFLATPACFLPPKSLISSRLQPEGAFLSFNLRRTARRPNQLKIVHFSNGFSRSRNLTPVHASGEATETDAVEETAAEASPGDETIAQEDNADGGEESPASAALSYLQSYKEALINGDESTISKVEAFLQSIEDEKNSLEIKAFALNEELTVEKDRVLRISADFDNFRKRTEREKQSLMTNVQGEVLENLLPVLDNFERAKAQIKVESEGEEKINNSYQSIYKQFFEIFNSLGVEAVETVGASFDPMLHEAIMREDSSEFEEGIILQEFRKGFKIGERLLRPSMVKVSAGPGPAKAQEDSPAQEAGQDANDEGESSA